MSCPGAPHDLIGPRVLVGVQMVDISRLSAHPVPLTHRGLITVAGQGPKDSNGAGKSSFIAALSLLHADDQWRLAGGAPGAAELLFTAELAAQEARWSNADRGYVIGVFADPAATTPEELDASVLTVWLRINRKAPYLSLRWTAGRHVPTGAGDAERAARVHELWDALPSRNGRDDFHAGRLASVLYGGRVRCVSFLSTSVRSAPTANLLAQPLNELSPARIFDALATLTGLDRELEQEQTLRTAEHNRRTEVAEAEAELTAWQHEMAVVETGIARREVARDVLTAARHAWRARSARHLLDGVARAEQLRHARGELDTSRDERRERLAELGERIRTLTDDTEFAARFRAGEGAWRRLREAERDLDGRIRRGSDRLDDLAAALRDATETARSADGRDTAQAAEQQAAAQAAVEELLARRGAALAEAELAAEQLTAARSGGDVAAEELRRLAAAGIPAAAVVDVVEPGAAQHGRWEPILAPYRDAVTVPSGFQDAARAALADVPGALLVVGDDGTALVVGASDPDLPPVTDARFGLGTFLAVLADRAGSAEGDVDPAAGLVVLGPATDHHGAGDGDAPLTGRSARISRAEERHEQAADRLDAVDRELARARTRLASAAERVVGATAADRVVALTDQIAELRELGGRLADDHDRLRPPLAAAEAAHAEALGDAKARQDRIETLRGDERRLRDELRAADDLATKLDDERARLDLLAREAAWGGTTATAESFLLELADDEAARSTADWSAETCHLLDDVARRCFPEDTPPEELPAELRALLVEQRWRRLGADAKVALAPDLARALATHLTLSAEQDRHDRRLIETQRTQRTADLAVARSGLAESQHSSAAYRAVLAQGIRAKLTKVGDEFDRLDREYGGYGAGLDCPEPEPPTEPDKPWRWTVTPRWRRAEGQRTSGYNLRGNTAQMDEKAVKLVCAAALAGSDDRPLLLILDELGRNLGKQHRREAVALFERIGRDRNITVIGALQDDMERYAIEASNLYIKLRRSSDAVAYNDAPVVLGDDTHTDRIALLADWMSAYREPQPRVADHNLIEALELRPSP